MQIAYYLCQKKENQGGRSSLLITMDEWDIAMEDSWAMLQDDNEDDEFITNVVSGFDLPRREVRVPKVWRGSTPGKAPNVDRSRVAMHSRMMLDYFVDIPVYGLTLF